MCHPTERDEVADLHLRRLDQHAVDEQLNQFPAAREGGVVQPVGNAGPERLHARGEHGDLRVLLRARRQLLLFPGEVGEPRFQRLHAGLQLLERDRLGGVGIDEPLALAIERGPALPQVALPRGARVVAEPPRLRASHRLVEHRRVGEHPAEVGPDHGIKRTGGDGLLLAARLALVVAGPRPGQAAVVGVTAIVADARGPAAPTAADQAAQEVFPLRALSS